MIAEYYQNYAIRIRRAKSVLKRPLTLTEKVIYSHLDTDDFKSAYQRRRDYLNLKPDRIAMQDATAQMALLQFMNSSCTKVNVPTTIHCDHLIVARKGAEPDLERALSENREVYEFLKSAAIKYGIVFWRPGAGIIHQTILENYAFPGGLLIGTDSHTANAGGLAMLGIGVGGADAVDVMTGIPWELKMPGIIGVELTSKLHGWTSAKDVILKLAGILSVKGATNTVIEYFGSGTSNLSCTGKATICNMGAELGATSSIFPFDNRMAEYLQITGREETTSLLTDIQNELRADAEIEQTPEKYYDQVIRLDLDALEPRINGPFTPDRAIPISQMATWIENQEYPARLAAGLIGSCTNSSYEDLARVASIARQANQHKIRAKIPLLINPGSQWIKDLCEKAGFLAELRRLGARILANACGPCIGQWERENPNLQKKNSIIVSFNRNFARRNDGNPNTCTFVASPEMVMALALSGDLRFNPLKDFLLTENGTKYYLQPPCGDDLPQQKISPDFSERLVSYNPETTIYINPDSERLQLLEPFPAWNGQPLCNLELLIKIKDKCTTDHISPAGKWLKYRGHLDHIANNLLAGAQNAFSNKSGVTLNRYTGEYQNIAAVARDYKLRKLASVIIADENYGEGSSREHAAMEPRHLGVIAVIAKSFARIHETNLKKQGILTLQFNQPEGYDLIAENDTFDILGLEQFTTGKSLTLIIRHQNGKIENLFLRHSYNQLQIEWFKAGSAMNYYRNQRAWQHE
jgi:aconitate hydratase